MQIPNNFARNLHLINKQQKCSSLSFASVLLSLWYAFVKTHTHIYNVNALERYPFKSSSSLVKLFGMQNTQAALINAEFSMHYLGASAGDPPKSKLQLILPTHMAYGLPLPHIHTHTTRH